VTDFKARSELLFELGCAFAACLELDELAPLVLTKCREVFDAEDASVLLLDPIARELYFPYVVSVRPEHAAQIEGLRFPADRGIAGAALSNGEVLHVDDVSLNPRFFSGVDHATGRTTRNLLAAPLRTRNGIIGVLEVVNRRGGGTFAEEDPTFLRAIAGSVAVAFENARLWEQLKSSTETLRAQVVAYRRDSARSGRFRAILGTSASMDQVFQLMASAASCSVTVLIEGETGTGKEMVARGIHAGGVRSEEAFLPVNCAALSESLLERELFGHKRGAFTDAVRDEPGIFEAANGGTIFLDEIGEMPSAMQPKLLRVLQEGEITRVGDTRPRKVDVRVIAATNRQLVEEIKSGRFREDLYYRISTFPIRVPPLRERVEDIPLLADHLLRNAAERHRRNPVGITAAALGMLTAFSWPGNVRELQNEIERALVLASDGIPIGPEHLSEKLRGRHELAEPYSNTGRDDRRPTLGRSGAHRPLHEARVAFETQHVATVLHANDNNVTRTAHALGISRVALQKKLKDLGLR
jgi:Nif-specific regulatory protein